MLDPFVSLEWKVLPVAVITASLFGSGHCVGMCGGLMLTVARDSSSLLRYHLGRWMGYGSLGALAGFLGAEFLQSAAFAGVLSWVSTGLLALGFIFLGIRLWSGKSIHFFSLPKGAFHFLGRSGPGVTGLLSAFLPCGWLHAFVLGAVATRSASWGFAYLSFFWLGTLPALVVTPWAAGRVFQPAIRRAPRISAVLLVLIGLSSLGLKMMPPQTAGCHCHDSAASAAESEDAEP